MTTLSLPVQIAAIVIFVVTYLGVALGRLPGLRLDRAAIAFCGAALMIGVGALPLADAYQAISGNTIALLFGMMVLAAGLRSSPMLRSAAPATRWPCSPPSSRLPVFSPPCWSMTRFAW
jgi:di/tricarboxylate transporter